MTGRARLRFCVDQGCLLTTADLPKGDFSALVAIVEEVLGELEEGEDGEAGDAAVACVPDVLQKKTQH